MFSEEGAVTRVMLESMAGEPLPDWPAALRSLTVIRLVRGQRLFWAGESCPFVFFVRRGLVKLCYETVDGEEWVKGFTPEGKFFASMRALRFGGSAGFTALALEPTDLERIEYACLLRLAETHPAWQRAVLRGLELFGMRKEERERELLTLSAMERYQAFVSENGALSQRVPQKDLARYLGITPVGLSRLRRRVAPTG